MVSGSGTIGYPYSAFSINIPIESYYLLNVISQEMNPQIYTEFVALQSQAIAARSYAHYQIENLPSPPYNNSSEFQVFVPFKFDSLNAYAVPIEPTPNPCSSGNLNATQQGVCNAAASKYYLAAAVPTDFVPPDNDKPAFAEFSSDVTYQTVRYSTPTPFGNRHPYIEQVEEPISQDNVCDANTDLNNAHGRGMSQEGAIRWARGHQCADPDYAVLPGTPEPTPGQAWSVKWMHKEQILFHYYTGVHLRDAENGNAILSPDHRWNPLNVTWQDQNGNPIPQPAALDPTQIYTATFFIQNTGVYRWASVQDACFDLHWFSSAEGSNVSSIGSCEYPIPSYPVEIGKDTEVEVTIDPSGRSGHYRLRFDMARMNDMGEWEIYSRIDPDRPWYSYDIEVCVGECPLYFPLLMKTNPTPTLRPTPPTGG